MNEKINIGELLKILFDSMLPSEPREEIVNSLLHVFIGDSLPDYKIDKTTVSKLVNHKVELAKKIKKILGSDEDHLKDFSNLLRNYLGEHYTDYCLSLNDALTKEKDASSLEVLALFKEKKLDAFAYESFKRACVLPNTQEKEKLNIGRPKKGSWESIFFLSQAEKEAEIAKFNALLLRSKAPLDRDDFKRMTELMCFARLSYSQEEKQMVSERFLANWRSGDIVSPGNEMLNELRNFSRAYGQKGKESFLNWEEPIRLAETKLKGEKFLSMCRKTLRDSSFADAYRSLTNSLWDSTFDLLPEQKKALISNAFFLPDFSGHITHSLWGYCNQIVALSVRLELFEELNQALDKIYQGSNKDATISDRVEYLKDKALESETKRQKK